MESNEKVEGILAGIKKLIFGEDAQSTTSVTAEATEYKLEDGTSITVSALEVGGEVKIADAPAPAGTHKLEDGSSIITDEAGIITEVLAKQEDAPSDSEGPLDTPEKMLAATQKFATGSPEERMANLELIAKALMEYSFGWQLREAEEKATRDQAIATYKLGFEEAKKEAAKQRDINKQLFELVSEITHVPAANPPGDEKKKSEFSKVGEKKKGLAKYAEALQTIAAENKA